MQSSKLKPILIIGTMKGGTTILYDFISSHSKILAGTKKEIHYFSLNYHKGHKWYLNYFDLNAKDKQYYIDASPTYFDKANSLTIANNIKSYDKDSKIILIVRDPILRAISHFTHLQKINKIKELQNLNANDFFEKDFCKSIAKSNELDRLLNEVLDFSCYTRKLMMYSSVFGANNILVLSNDDLKNNARKIMKKTYDFLELEYEENMDYSQFRYSNRSGLKDLSKQTFEKLSNLLYPDYQLFCKKTGIKFEPIIFEEDG